MDTKWAILLLKLSDQNTEPFARTYAEQMFTAAGVGTGNMVDFYRDMSHGRADPIGSEVFGWFLLDHSTADLAQYAKQLAEEDKKNNTQLANSKRRARIVEWGREAATANNVDLSKFYGTVFVFSQGVDYFGYSGVAVVNYNAADEASFSVDLTGVGHEMGHGYGLTHSRREGSGDEYGDVWDIMSAYNGVHEARPGTVPPSVSRPYHSFGPGLNAASMHTQGWLDETRVYALGSTPSAIVTLRPLHRRDLPGFLAARFAQVFVEFRMKDRWDAAIPAPAVLVHRKGVHPSSGVNCSYLLSGKKANGTSVQALGAGDSWEGGSLNNIYDEYLKATVRRIDPGTQEADIEFLFRPAQRPPVTGPGIIIGGVAEDGGGYIFVPGRGFVKVPPRSPLLTVLEKFAAFQLIQDSDAPQREIMSITDRVLEDARLALDRMIAARREFHVPAPRAGQRRRGSAKAPALEKPQKPKP